MAESNWGDFLGDTLGNATSQTTDEAAGTPGAETSAAPDPTQTDPAEPAEDASPALDEAATLAPEGVATAAALAEDSTPPADATTEPAAAPEPDSPTEPAAGPEPPADATTEPAPVPEPAGFEPAAAMPSNGEAATWDSWAQHDMAEAAVLSEVASEHLQAASEWAAYGNIEEAREELAHAELAAEMAQMEGQMAFMEERLADAAASEPSWDTFGTSAADQSQADSWSGQDATDAGSSGYGQDTQFEPQPEPEPEPDFSTGSDERELQDGNPF